MSKHDAARIRARLEDAITREMDSVMAEEGVRDPRVRFPLLAAALLRRYVAALQTCGLPMEQIEAMIREDIAELRDMSSTQDDADVFANSPFLH